MRFVSSCWKLMKGSRALYVWSLVVQVFMVVSTIFTSFLSKVLADSLTALMNGAPFLPDAGLESWVVLMLTGGAGPDYLQEHLYILPIAVGVSGAIAAGFSCLRSLLRVRSSVAINKNMQMVLFTHLDRLPYLYFKKHKAGDILQTATRDLDVMRRFLIMDFGSINYTFWVVLICLSLLLSLSPQYTLVALSPFPFMFVYSFFLIKKVRRLYRETDDSEARMTDKISENLNAVRIVKAYNAETYEIDEFEKKLVDYRQHFVRWRKFSSFFFASSDIFVFGAKSLSIIYGLALAIEGQISSGTLVICVSFVNMMVWPLRNVATILSNLGQVLASHDRIQKILAEPIEDMESGQEPEINGDIVFDHVSYQFEDGDHQVLNDVSFSVKPGQTVAVMGKTGSGKSTLFALLMRLHDYTDGSIKVSGVELRDIKRSHLRKKIAPVLQDPFLFSKTIYENIHLANKDATREDVVRAAKIAAVDDTINSFQQGYETPVGEKGVTLSGGQKQRVAIARTISSNAPVLIFDDSLSAVDTATDLEIRRHLKEMGRTVTTFIITHRVMSAKDADMILVLDHGRVSEMGTHEELIKKPGLYKTIYEIQSKMA